jgi:hypothetical protein
MNQVKGQGHTGQVIEKHLSGAKLLHGQRDYNKTWHKCSPLQGGVFIAGRSVACKI